MKMRHLVLPLAASLAGAVSLAAQDSNMILPPQELERILREEDFQFLNMVTSRGLASERTYQATVKLGESGLLQMKFAPAGKGADSFNNRPRYEIAAYEIQKLFLDPEEYVVPPTVGRCFPLDEVQNALNLVASNPKPEAPRTFDAWPMTLVVLQYWLWNVEIPDELRDRDRLREDELYARHLGNFNLFTYLIRHNDSNEGNFLRSTDPANPRVFSVDNGVAFSNEESDRGTYWRDLKLDRYPRKAIDRLREYTLEDLYAKLGVVAQFEIRGPDFVQVEPTGNLDPGKGVRRYDNGFQLGLTDSEIRRVYRRLERLIQWIDDGRYEVF